MVRCGGAGSWLPSAHGDGLLAPTCLTSACFTSPLAGSPAAPIQTDELDCHRFVRFLRLATTRARWRVLAYCLMTNHFHLVVLCEREAMTRGMHTLNGRHAQTFNARHGRRGHLFQERFHAQVVRDEVHLATACAYVVDNPVRAGLCPTREAWQWSGGELA